MLGIIKDEEYILTDDGKRVLVEEIYNRRNNIKPREFDDKMFNELVLFIMENLNESFNQSLNYGMKVSDSELDRKLKEKENYHKIMLMFDAYAALKNISKEDLYNAMMNIMHSVKQFLNFIPTLGNVIDTIYFFEDLNNKNIYGLNENSPYVVNPQIRR